MDGNDDVRSDAGYRAPDPSIEEMLRRARDARLGDADGTTPWQSPLRSVTETLPAWRRGRGLPGRVSFLAGMVVGVLLMDLVVRASALASNVVSPTQPLAPLAPATTTALPPTPTNTPLPTPTDVPTATPLPTALPTPTTDQIVVLVQQFYDTQSMFAGTYVFVDATAIEIQSQDDTQLTACIVYEYALASSPNTAAGTDTRTFTLAPAGDSTWQVVQLGDSGSCSPS